MKKLFGLALSFALGLALGTFVPTSAQDTQCRFFQHWDFETCAIKGISSIETDAVTIRSTDSFYVLADDGDTFIHVQWDAKGGARATPLTPSEAALKGLLAPAP